MRAAVNRSIECSALWQPLSMRRVDSHSADDPSPSHPLFCGYRLPLSRTWRPMWCPGRVASRHVDVERPSLALVSLSILRLTTHIAAIGDPLVRREKQGAPFPYVQWPASEPRGLPSWLVPWPTQGGRSRSSSRGGSSSIGTSRLMTVHGGHLAAG